MTSTTGTPHEASRAYLEQELSDWAQRSFPGITDLGWRSSNRGGAGEAVPFFGGTWHGLTLELKRFGHHHGNPTHAAWVLARCETCERWAIAGFPGLPLYSAADVAENYPEDLPPATIPACFGCRWLREAQADARTRRTRFARWRFKVTRQVTVEEILARTP